MNYPCLAVIFYPFILSVTQFEHFPVVTRKSNITVITSKSNNSVVRAGYLVQDQQDNLGSRLEKNGNVQDLIDFISNDNKNVREKKRIKQRNRMALKNISIDDTRMKGKNESINRRNVMKRIKEVENIRIVQTDIKDEQQMSRLRKVFRLHSEHVSTHSPDLGRMHSTSTGQGHMVATTRGRRRRTRGKKKKVVEKSELTTLVQASRRTSSMRNVIRRKTAQKKIQLKIKITSQ